MRSASCRVSAPQLSCRFALPPVKAVAIAPPRGVTDAPCLPLCASAQEASRTMDTAVNRPAGTPPFTPLERVGPGSARRSRRQSKGGRPPHGEAR